MLIISIQMGFAKEMPLYFLRKVEYFSSFCSKELWKEERMEWSGMEWAGLFLSITHEKHEGIHFDSYFLTGSDQAFVARA